MSGWEMGVVVDLERGSVSGNGVSEKRWGGCES